MSTLRFLGLAFGLMVVAFFGYQRSLGPRPVQPDPRLPAFHRVDPNDPRTKMEMTSFASDNDAVRDGLRKAVLETAKALREEPCNSALKASYAEAATRYVRAWLSVAHCVGNGCGSLEAARERAGQAFGTPLDRRTREAMKKTHETGVLTAADFPADVTIILAQFAADPVINPLADAGIKADTQASRPEISCRAASLR